MKAWYQALVEDAKANLERVPLPSACAVVCANYAKPDAVKALTGANSYQDLLTLTKKAYPELKLARCPSSQIMTPHLEAQSKMPCVVGRVALAVTHLRKNADFDFLSVIFQHSFAVGSGILSEITDDLTERIITKLMPNHICWTAPKDLSKHRPPSGHTAGFAAWDWGSRVIAVCDQGYLHVDQHSSNLEFAKLTRSWQKKGSLAKLHVITLLDGTPLPFNQLLSAADDRGNDNAILHHWVLYVWHKSCAS
jgi:hypothetical protein